MKAFDYLTARFGLPSAFYFVAELKCCVPGDMSLSMTALFFIKR